jgi:peptidoglycan/LPS O-acetylase OafA/YrhL
MSHAGYVWRSVRRMRGRTDRVPTTDQLTGNALRHLAGAALVVLAAAAVHRSGHEDQQWQYVAVAAALVPQALMDALAAGDADRRRRLRTSTLPSAVPLLAAVLLGVAALWTLLTGGPLAVAAAGACAAAGLAVAAAPVAITIAPRPRRRPD